MNGARPGWIPVLCVVDGFRNKEKVPIMPPRKPRKPLNPRKRKLPEDGPFTSSVKWLKSFVFTPVEDGPWPIVEPMD